MPKSDLPTNDAAIMAKYTRYNELYIKANKTTAENTELAGLQTDLADYLITATDWNGLFTSVSDGKNQVATAITGKGIAASGSDTYGQLSSKISSIQTGSNTSDGTANADDILSPKVAYSKNQRIVGTLSLSGNATDSQVLFGQTYYNNDAKTKRSGTMPNRAGASVGGSATTSDNAGKIIITPQPGYYDTASKVTANDPNFIAANILSGKTIFGVVGTATTGRRFASGTGIAQDTRLYSDSMNQMFWYPFINISGLAFTPRTIITYSQYGSVITGYSAEAPAWSDGYRYQFIPNHNDARVNDPNSNYGMQISGGSVTGIPAAGGNGVTTYWFAFE